MVYAFQATTFFQSGVYANHNIGEGKMQYTRGKKFKNRLVEKAWHAKNLSDSLCLKNELIKKQKHLSGRQAFFSRSSKIRRLNKLKAH